MKCDNSPRYEIPETLLSSFKNSTAIESGAGEKVKILWMTLVVSILNFGSDVPILIARPKDSLASWAMVHSEMRYRLGATRDITGQSKNGLNQVRI